MKPAIGVSLVLCCVAYGAVGCSEEPAKKPFKYPVVTYPQGDGDGSDGTGDGDYDYGDGDSYGYGDGDSYGYGDGDGDIDSGTGDGDMDSGTGDAGVDSGAGDAASTDAEVDAEAETDASSEADASSEPDASDEPDSGSERDAGELQCGQQEPLLGDTCPGVVTCQSEGSSTDYPSCTLFNGSGNRVKHCCVTSPEGNNACRNTACDVTQAEAACDGPEDCSKDGPGFCCIGGFNLNTGDTACQKTACAKPDRTLCHKDADCPVKHHCEAGHEIELYPYVTTPGLAWWGFCHPD